MDPAPADSPAVDHAAPVAAVLELRLPSPEAAEAARQALEPDNDGLVRLSRDGATLRVAASSASPMGLLRTLDDVLACLRALGLP